MPKDATLTVRMNRALPEAVATAGKADVILLCLGEKRNWSGENASRASIALAEDTGEISDGTEEDRQTDCADSLQRTSVGTLPSGAGL